MSFHSSYKAPPLWQRLITTQVLYAGLDCCSSLDAMAFGSAPKVSEERPFSAAFEGRASNSKLVGELPRREAFHERGKDFQDYVISFPRQVGLHGHKTQYRLIILSLLLAFSSLRGRSSISRGRQCLSRVISLSRFWSTLGLSWACGTARCEMRK